MKNIIEVKNLKKSYKDVEAVKGISFSVEQSSFFAFLGENGAGKSTTINIIATLLKKSSGEVKINGYKVDKNDYEIRKNIGVVFQNNMLDNHLTVKENIISRGKMYHLSKAEISARLKILSKTIGLTDFLDRRYGKLSGGQKRRSDIARALIHNPKILILDEPTTGLDPKTRKAVWIMIKNLKEKTGLTVFLTTHYMEEAASADYIVIIDAGRIKALGTPQDLRQKFSSDRLVILPRQRDHLINGLHNIGHTYEAGKETITIKLSNSIEAIEIVSKLKDDIYGFEVIRGNMDDVFINVLSEKIKCEVM